MAARRCGFGVPEGAIQIFLLSNCGCVCGPSRWLPEETARELAFVPLSLELPQDRSGFPGGVWKHLKIKSCPLTTQEQRRQRIAAQVVIDTLNSSGGKWLGKELLRGLRVYKAPVCTKGFRRLRALTRLDAGSEMTRKVLSFHFRLTFRPQKQEATDKVEL